MTLLKDASTDIRKVSFDPPSFGLFFFGVFGHVQPYKLLNLVKISSKSNNSMLIENIDLTIYDIPEIIHCTTKGE